MLDTLHPSGFIETGPETCDGPRYIRNQPSRETPGILLQDKYITEPNNSNSTSSSVDFNLPFRNAIRNTLMLQSMYDKLDHDQQIVINDKIRSITRGSVNLESTGEDQYPIQDSIYNNLSNPENQNIQKSFITQPIGIIGIILFVLCILFIIGRQ